MRPDYSLYLVNDVGAAENNQAIENIKKARAALDCAIDESLRNDYERNMLTALPGIAFPSSAFNEVRAGAIAALTDYSLSPCAYFSGDQAEKQGIPKEAITKPVRCYTTNVRAAVPNLPDLLDAPFVHAVRSCIGSNFTLMEDVLLTRNYPVEGLEKYDILSDRWHFDHKLNDIFYLFVNLSHVTMEDGPTHIISAPDSRALFSAGFNCALRPVDPNGGLPASAFKIPSLKLSCGPPGTILMSHTSLCLHKAGTPQPGHVRDVMILSFRHSEKMDISWAK